MKEFSFLDHTQENLGDKLLQQIEQGDPTVILAEENAFILNELIKHEFVSIDRERLRLTEKGLKAKAVGVKAYLQSQRPVKERETLVKSEKTISRSLYSPFLILLLFLFISLIFLFVVVEINL